MAKNIFLDGTEIGRGCKPYVIAEVSANHNGSIEKAKEIISSAARNGADAVKLQTYTADTITIKSDRPEFRIKGGLWDGYQLWDLYDWAHTPFEWHPELFDHARKEGITCFSSPFDDTAVDLLEGLNAPLYKIASFEMTDLPLIRKVAATQKPMIMSTGLASLEEIEKSLSVARDVGSGEIVLLHCISGYPTPLEQANLKLMLELQETFDVLVGLSDHTLANTAAIAAVSIGACIIEKHFTLARSEGGADAEFSMEPPQLKALCEDTEGAWKSMGDGVRLTPSVQDNNRVFRRSIYTVGPIQKGDVFTKDNIRCIRPGLGLPPELYDKVLGKKAASDIDYGTPLETTHIEGGVA
ncbi:MAG: pseudaminic acid synthase [Pseudomonadota bacterium]